MTSVLLGFLLTFLSFLHPFYVSVTEIEQNRETMALQVSSRIFFDDLERALNRTYKVKTNILRPTDRKQVDAMIAAYVTAHLKIRVNGEPVVLKYLGYEIEEEAAWCYFETVKTATVKKLEIRNDILFEQHETQINMMHVTVGGQRKSTKLDNPAATASFSF